MVKYCDYHHTEWSAGVIDAAVNGGVSKYREAFLSGHETSSHYSEAKKERLQVVLRKQLGLLEEGMKLHSRLISSDYRGLHEKLEGTYHLITGCVNEILCRIFCQNAAANITV